MNRSQLVRKGGGRKRGREPTERQSNERERLGQVCQRISLQLVERKKVGRRTEEGKERRIRNQNRVLHEYILRLQV